MSEKFKYSDDQLKDLLNGIFDGSVTEYNIPEDLYFAIVDYLKSGLYEGFGGSLVDFKGKDLELLEELRTNVYLFSGGKAYHQLKEYRSLLFDENEDLRSKREFTRLGAAEFEKWNEAWGLTERQTAIGQAQMAIKWNEIEANKDLLPILEFSTNGKACPICAPYDKFTAPVKDKVWSWATPLLHFNCECIILQHEADKEISNKARYKEISDLKETVPIDFQINPGKDKVIFPDTHPYFDVPKEDVKFAKINFGLPIPERD